MRFQLAFVTICAAITANSCAPQIVNMQSVPSSDGVFAADWYQACVGGAASYSVDCVRLRDAAEPFKARYDYSFAALEANVIQVRWVANRELEVIYPDTTPLKRAEPKWRDVAIKYVAMTFPARKRTPMTAAAYVDGFPCVTRQ
jgi:hypothetical protein